MNRLVLIAAFAVAAVFAFFVAGLLKRTRKEWSARRRLWIAAFALPCLILGATAGGIAWVLISGPGRGENIQDFSVTATALVGASFTIIALIGGIVGGSLARG